MQSQCVHRSFTTIQSVLSLMSQSPTISAGNVSATPLVSQFVKDEKEERSRDRRRIRKTKKNEREKKRKRERGDRTRLAEVSVLLLSRASSLVARDGDGSDYGVGTFQSVLVRDGMY